MQLKTPGANRIAPFRRFFSHSVASERIVGLIVGSLAVVHGLLHIITTLPYIAIGYVVTYIPAYLPTIWKFCLTSCTKDRTDGGCQLGLSDIIPFRIAPLCVLLSYGKLYIYYYLRSTANYNIWHMHLFIPPLHSPLSSPGTPAFS